MPDDSAQDSAKELEHLARLRFPDPPLSKAEEKLVRAAPDGYVAVCGPNMNWDDPANDPSKAEEWGADREIRAELIRWLCVDRRAKELVDPRGIQVVGAKISDSLDLDNVTIPFRLRLQRCLLMQELTLIGAQMPVLDLQHTRVRAITADGVIVKGDVFFSEGFSAKGEVRLLGAQIEGDLNCSGAMFENPAKAGGTGNALSADRAVIKGSVFLRNGSSTKGEVRLLGAQIGSNLDCEGATFENPPQNGAIGSGTALNMDHTLVKGSVFLRDGFSTNGEVRLLGAQIGGNLECDRATFENPPQNGVTGSGTALNAERGAVSGHIFLRDGFKTTGDVRLMGVQTGGGLSCRGASISGTLLAQTAVIKGTFFWTRIDPKGIALDLTNASAGALVDDAGSRLTAGKLILDGFIYGRISGSAPKDVTSRLDWLDRQKSFAPQPYRQLAKVLRDEGDDAGARRVLFEMEDRRRGQEDPWYAWPWSSILKVTIGYGYYPGFSLAWLLFFVLLGWPFFRRAYFAGNIAPSHKDAYYSFQSDHHPPLHYERFYASIYSLEKTFPLIKLGQVDLWQPNPNPSPTNPVVANPPCHSANWLISPEFLRWFGWCQTILGWFLATLFAAGVTGVIRND